MIRLMFIPDTQLYKFTDTNIIHGKPKVGFLSDLNCPQVVGDFTSEQNTYVTSTSITMLVLMNASNLHEVESFEWDCDTFQTNGNLGPEFSCTIDPLPSLKLYCTDFCIDNEHKTFACVNALYERAVLLMEKN